MTTHEILRAFRNDCDTPAQALHYIETVTVPGAYSPAVVAALSGASSWADVFAKEAA